MLLDLWPQLSGVTPAVRFTDPFDPPRPRMLAHSRPRLLVDAGTGDLVVTGSPRLSNFDPPSPRLEVD